MAALQERPEDVPTGELPRAVTLVADRHLVGRVAPGTRVTVTGIYSICQASPDLYLHVKGVGYLSIADGHKMDTVWKV